MKKTGILLIALMVIGVGFLSGCNEQTGVTTNEEEKFVGTWYKEGGSATFFSDGSAVDPQGMANDWELKDGNLVISYEFEGTELSIIYDYSFSNNQKTLTIVRKDTGEVIVYNKEKTSNTDDDGGDEGENENISPFAIASSDVNIGSEPLTVEFIGSGTDTDGTIALYHWEFGDGETSNDQSPTHTYDDAGTFYAQLTVTDNDGATDTDTVIIIVSESLGPGSSRSNPASIGASLTYEKEDDWLYEDYKVRITLVQIIRGNQAWNMIEEANMFNDPPDTGNEYILAKIRFEYQECSDPDTQYDVSQFDFTAVSDNGKDYEWVSIVCPEPKLSADLYPGASVEGWAAFEVDIDDNPLLTFGRDYQGKDGIWFKLYY